MSSRIVVTTCLAMVLAAGSLLAADSDPARMDVTATVVPNCRLTVNALSFGIYDPLANHSTQPADATTIMRVNCTRATGASVSFDSGRNGAAGGERLLAGPGSERLRYQIFRDSARSQVWGIGAESFVFLSRGVTQPEELTVFGRILPSQEVSPGSYADILTATVHF
jgi:spore coat protein U-like protein